MAIRSTLLAASALVAAAVAAGCYTGSAVDVNRSPDSPTTTTDGTTPIGKAGSNVHGLTHLPCDVEKLLSDQCWECHGTVPGFNASTTLVTYDDITKTSMIGGKEADLMVLRMQSTGDPMPPDTPATSDQIAVLTNWIAAGYPQGHCGETADSDGGTAEGGTTTGGTTTGGDDDDDASQAPSVCTSGKTIPTTTHGSTMRPGEACINCHGPSADTTFTLAGTIYPTPNEPDDCVGATTANVVVIDANGTSHTYNPSSSGNFYTEDDVPGPFTVMVVNGATTKQMKTPISNGDCNSCHTANPQPGQPGRIVSP